LCPRLQRVRNFAKSKVGGGGEALETAVHRYFNLARSRLLCG
jgi:hypothetical protein